MKYIRVQAKDTEAEKEKETKNVPNEQLMKSSGERRMKKQAQSIIIKKQQQLEVMKMLRNG